MGEGGSKGKEDVELFADPSSSPSSKSRRDGKEEELRLEFGDMGSCEPRGVLCKAM